MKRLPEEFKDIAHKSSLFKKKIVLEADIADHESTQRKTPFQLKKMELIERQKFDFKKSHPDLYIFDEKQGDFVPNKTIKPQNLYLKNFFSLGKVQKLSGNYIFTVPEEDLQYE